MRKFLLNTFLFVGISIGILGAILLSPATPSASDSLLYTSQKKDSLLEHTPSPRLIVLAGSSSYFGLDSKRLKDSLNVNPINAGIHAGIGLEFMLKKIEPSIKDGDVLILSLEYEQLCGKIAYGSEPLFRMIFDVDLNNIRYISKTEQVSSLLSYFPKYTSSKLDIKSYTKRSIPEVYRYTASNEYGDAYKHWGITHKTIEPIKMEGELNEQVIESLREFIARVEKKGCKIALAYPSLETESFTKSSALISAVDSVYHTLGVEILGTPIQNTVSDSLLFDTSYHLNGLGVAKHTSLLIEEIRNSNILKQKTED